MKKYLIFIIAAVILAAGGCGILKENVGESVAEEAALSQFEEIKSGEEVAVLTTDFGVIKIRFFESDAPMAVADFKGLAREGYYDGTKISRITEYYIRTGAAGDGKEDRSIYKNKQGETVPFKDEFSKSAPHFYGAVSMVNSGVKDSNLSQFFIVVSDSLGESVAETLKTLGYPQNVIEKYAETGGAPQYDYQNTVFGCVFEGMDVVKKIAESETDREEPLREIVIRKIEILKADTE